MWSKLVYLRSICSNLSDDTMISLRIHYKIKLYQNRCHLISSKSKFKAQSLPFTPNISLLIIRPVPWCITDHKACSELLCTQYTPLHNIFFCIFLISVFSTQISDFKASLKLKRAYLALAVGKFSTL